MTYRIIALDLDGTLLDSKKRILPESLSALAQARAEGVKVVGGHWPPSCGDSPVLSGFSTRHPRNLL